MTDSRAALVEKMAMAAHEAWVRLEEEREPFCIVNHWSELHKDERREAIWSMSDALDVAQAHIRAETLEEAARVAEEVKRVNIDDGPDNYADGPTKVAIAAAIRARKEAPCSSS